MVELALLQDIMRHVGFNIPIQELFDLVIGTSTGGVIALGIFKRGWSVAEAFEHFETMANRAFSKRFFLKPFIGIVPGARLGAQVCCRYLYTSDGIEGAMKEAFGESTTLFEGGSEYRKPQACKVGVVVVSEEERRLCILTNYNREWRVNDELSKIPV